MRLINAYALMSKAFTDERGYNVVYVDDIFKEPTIDAEPIKHGRWLSHFEYCKLHNYSPSGTSVHFWCSRCESAAKEKTLYCPNCGARMDGGK